MSNLKKELNNIRLGWEDCPTCGGSGKAFGINCGDCGGMGVVTTKQADNIRKSTPSTPKNSITQ